MGRAGGSSRSPMKMSFRVSFPLMLVLVFVLAQLCSSTAAADGSASAGVAPALRRTIPEDEFDFGVEDAKRMLESSSTAKASSSTAKASTSTSTSTAKASSSTTKPSSSTTKPSTSTTKPSSKTTTEHVTIWTKLKESLGLAIVGLLLICISPVVLWKNEGRHVNELKRIDFCKNNAVAVDCDSPSEDDVGRLVHFVGTVSVGDSALDLASGGTTYGSDGGGLNVTGPVPNAVAVRRKCSIYQKFETSDTTVEKDKIGGGETRTTEYAVREDWTMYGPGEEQLENLPEETNSRGVWDGLVEAAAGNTGDAGEEAPQGLAATSDARVGDFALSQDIILNNRSAFMSEWEPVPNELLPDAVDGCDGLEKGSDNILRTFPEGEDPQNGDCKVEYEYATDGFKCSFVVQQEAKSDPEAGFGVDKCDVVDAQCFGKCTDDLGSVWMVRRGVHDLEEMIDLATQEENACTTIIRVIGWAALFGGWYMLFTPFTTALQVLPLLTYLGGFAVAIFGLITSCLCFCTVVTAAYVRYRPLLAIGLLALAGGIWGIVAWRLSVAAEEAPETT